MKEVVIVFSNPSNNYPSILTDEDEMQDTAIYISNLLNKNNIKNSLFGIKNNFKEIEVFLKGKKVVVFNLFEHLDGNYKYEYRFARFLEKKKIPFTGNPSYALKIAQDKAKTKIIMKKARIPVLPYKIFKDESQVKEMPFKPPLIVKPLFQDGSAGITRDSYVIDIIGLKKAISIINENFKEPSLVEPFISGREFNVSVIGRRKKIVLPISEIDYSGLPPSILPFLTYKAKWKKEDIEYKLTKPICPARLPKKIEIKIKKIALEAGNVLGCRDYYRVDMRMDEKGNLFLLEVNPNPDISPDAGLARALNAKGISYENFILKLLKWAR